jgi:antitoxin (DNA-binding transcriptional repressor) of toxin-antitoxin stability system
MEVGVRELRNHLSRYLQLVRRTATVLDAATAEGTTVAVLP